jgi:hypothetical protein
VVIWPLAPLVGLVMAVSLADLVCLYPDQRGGIGVASAQALPASQPAPRGLVRSLVPASLLGTLFLTLNTVVVASSRALMQMPRNGEAWGRHVADERPS